MATNGKSHMERGKPSGELDKEWGSRGPFPFSSLLLFTLSFALFYTKRPSGYLFVVPWRDKKRACRIYMILLNLHKSRFCLAVSEVKLKERFSHQKLRNFLNGYKLFPRNNEKQYLVTIFIVEKQYLVIYVRYIRTRWQSATCSTSCKELQRKYLVVFCENRPDPNRLETWKYNRLITTNKTSR